MSKVIIILFLSNILFIPSYAQAAECNSDGICSKSVCDIDGNNCKEVFFMSEEVKQNILDTKRAEIIKSYEDIENDFSHINRSILNDPMFSQQDGSNSESTQILAGKVLRINTSNKNRCLQIQNELLSKRKEGFKTGSKIYSLCEEEYDYNRKLETPNTHLYDSQVRPFPFVSLTVIKEGILDKNLGKEEKNKIINSAYAELEAMENMYKSGLTIASREYFIPIELSDSEVIGALAMAGIGLIVFATDQELMNFVQDHKNGVTKKIEDYGYIGGGKKFLIGSMAGVYLVGTLTKNKKLKKLGLVAATAGLATQIITEAVKVTTGRTRPSNADGPYEFGGDNKSFFSGHSAGAFSLATAISEVYGDDWAGTPYVAYGLASLVAYARVHDEGHYTSDVLFGALAGILITKMVFRMFENNKNRSGGILLFPTFNSKNNSFMLNMLYQPKK